MYFWSKDTFEKFSYLITILRFFFQKINCQSCKEIQRWHFWQSNRCCYWYYLAFSHFHSICNTSAKKYGISFLCCNLGTQRKVERNCNFVQRKLWAYFITAKESWMKKKITNLWCSECCCFTKLLFWQLFQKSTVLEKETL